jgi:hypothetical protein
MRLPAAGAMYVWVFWRVSANHECFPGIRMTTERTAIGLPRSAARRHATHSRTRANTALYLSFLYG